MTSKNFLSRLMKMSWAIQQSKRSSRANSLKAAWAILSNEEITIFFLAKRLNHDRPVKAKALHQISLFNPTSL